MTDPRRILYRILLLVSLIGFGRNGAWAMESEEEVYLSPSAFIAEAFADGAPGEPQRLWLTAEVQAEVRQILDHNYAGLRLRYWQREDRTAWILEEIGKVKPITTGIVVEDGAIQKLQVLVYRESHGWEVRHSFFTDQFKGVTLLDGTKLDAPIDGITGATLSVNALRKLGRLALYFDRCVQALPNS